MVLSLERGKALEGPARKEPYLICARSGSLRTRDGSLNHPLEIDFKDNFKRPGSIFPVETEFSNLIERHTIYYMK